MALYSFGRIKIVSRNGVKSAVATAAYHAGTMFENEYDGTTHDYRDKANVGETYIRMPESAPAAWRDESIPAKRRLGMIWNAVEMASPAQNARLARTNYLALQRELTLEQNLECVDRWIKLNCTDVGMGATYTVHLKDGNPHVDVMYLANEYGADGKPKVKAKKEYLCRNDTGEEQHMDAAAFKGSTGWQKVYKYQKDGQRQDMTPSEAAAADGWERINKYPVCRTVKIGGWDDDMDMAKHWRESWAMVLNEKFEELGLDVRVDHRSNEERGLLRKATKHVGWGPDREDNLQHNAEIERFNDELQQLHQDAVYEIRCIRAQVSDLQNQPQTAKSLIEHEVEYLQHEDVLLAITEAAVFSQTIAERLREQLDKLYKAFIELLMSWKGRLAGKHALDVQKAAQTAQEGAEDVQRSLDDILGAAYERSEETDGGSTQLIEKTYAGK